MDRRDLTRLLLASASGASAAVLSSNAQAQSCIAPCYPVTSTELPSAVIDTSHPPGSFLRYGADPGNHPDNATQTTAAINNALKFNPVAFDDYPGGGAIYVINGPLQFQRTGQVLRGQGFGEVLPDGHTVVGGTTFRAASGFNGPLVKFSVGTSNVSDCVLDGVLIDGFHTANRGVDVYTDGGNDTGNWRNKITNCSIWNVTGAGNSPPTAVYLGLGRPFANDATLENVYINNTARGFSGAGAIYRLFSCSTKFCSEAAIHAATGSYWTAHACVFSASGWDFDGTGIQEADFNGCWFEESSQGIYRASVAHSATFTGCNLHTSNSQHLMDFGDAAGYHFIAGHNISSTTAAQNIVNVNPTATGAVLGQALPLFYATTGAYVPLILQPLQTGTAAVRSASATLMPGQQVVLPLGRGAFFVAVDVWWTQSANVRTQSTYSAFLFDGDNEGVTLIASRSGSGGGQAFTLAASGNAVTLTYTGNLAVSAFISGTGVVG